MIFDWTITLGSVLTILGFIVSMLLGYYAMVRDTDKRFASVMSHTDARFSDLITKEDHRFADLNVRLEKIFEGDIRELRGQTASLQGRHDELMKDMIERSHESKNQINTLVLKVDRLERPGTGR